MPLTIRWTMVDPRPCRTGLWIRPQQAWNGVKARLSTYPAPRPSSSTSTRQRSGDWWRSTTPTIMPDAFSGFCRGQCLQGSAARPRSALLTHLFRRATLAALRTAAGADLLTTRRFASTPSSGWWSQRRKPIPDAWLSRSTDQHSGYRPCPQGTSGGHGLRSIAVSDHPGRSATARRRPRQWDTARTARAAISSRWMSSPLRFEGHAAERQVLLRTSTRYPGCTVAWRRLRL